MNLNRNYWENASAELAPRIRIMERISTAISHLQLSEKSLRSLEWKAWLASRLLNAVIHLLDEVMSQARVRINPELQKMAAHSAANGAVLEESDEQNDRIVDLGLYDKVSPVLRLFYSIFNEAFKINAERIEFEIKRSKSFHGLRVYFIVSGKSQNEQPLPMIIWENLMEALHFHCLPSATELHQAHGVFNLRRGDTMVRCIVTFSHPDPRDATKATVDLTYFK